MAFNLFYYIRRFSFNALPDFYFKRNYKRLLEFEKECDQEVLSIRLNYYNKLNNDFNVPSQAVYVKDFKRTKGTDYYLDLKEFLHYFTPEARFAYHFGDDTHLNSYPTLFKARPIEGENANSVLFKLNKRRHFYWVKDTMAFSEKENRMVWRGGAYQKLRRDFVEKCWNHPMCDIGQTNKPIEEVPWQKDHLTIAEQLKFKFIFCPEGNDVATNLKWVMSSNSLCFMPKPKFETWFMEGILKPGIHYVEINNEYTDLEEKISYYSTHIDEAEQIIKNANEHVERFKNPNLEDLLCLKVLEKYANLSGQSNTLKFQ
jgi:hypothetical protein